MNTDSNEDKMIVYIENQQQIQLFNFYQLLHLIIDDER